MLRKYKIFEARHEQAVTELKEDVFIVFGDQLKKFRVSSE